MGINEEIVALRTKMVEAVRVGFFDEETKGTYEMTRLQVMNEADRQRRNCANRAEQLKMQAATAEGQAGKQTQGQHIQAEGAVRAQTQAERNAGPHRVVQATAAQQSGQEKQAGKDQKRRIDAGHSNATEIDVPASDSYKKGHRQAKARPS